LEDHKKLNTIRYSILITEGKMKSSRQNKKEEVKVTPSSSKEAISHVKVTPKKVAKVAEVEVEEKENKSDNIQDSIISPTASPNGSKSRKSVVTPLKSETKVASGSTKSPKNAFVRNTTAIEIEGETPVKKAPVEVSPLVELVYRYKQLSSLSCHVSPKHHCFAYKTKIFLIINLL
jgi:hypothetical protein